MNNKKNLLLIYLIEKQIRDIPYKHYGNQDKLVFNMDLDKFDWVPLTNPPPKKTQPTPSTDTPPFVLNTSLCTEYLSNLNLKGKYKLNSYVQIIF